MKQFVRKFVPAPVTKTLEKAYRAVRGVFWQGVYGFPAKSLKIIAVSGTNGKSTTCSYINEILKTAGYKTAVLTTPYIEIAGVYQPSGTTYTLQKQSILQRFLARAKKADVDWVVLETTSHALDQNRLAGLSVEVAVITNLTQDHLDYHGTMENYAAAKARLLADFGAKYTILNADDKWYDFFEKSSRAEVFSFGKSKDATAQISSIKTDSAGSSAIFATKAVKLPIKTSLLGEFNLYNACAAASVGFVLGINGQNIAIGVKNLKAVAGRMEPVGGRQNFTVLVDYAYTPDAILRTLETLQQIARGKVRIVFGATGDRDKTKRPVMGEVAAKNADFIYLTDDETYTEDPKNIRDAVYAGIKSAGGEAKTKVIEDRAEAIKTAIKDAQAGDIVLLAGMGHETTRNMGGEQIPWSDKEIAQKILATNP